MKLQNDFQYVCEEFGAYYDKNRLDWNEYAKCVENDARAKNIDVRLSWDMARMSHVLHTLSVKYWNDSDIHDEHYTTLFIAAYKKTVITQ